MRGCITSGEQRVFFVYEKRDDTSLLQTNTLLGHILRAWRLSSAFFMIGYVIHNQNIGLPNITIL
jgi:hypothetical protein